MGTIWDFIKQIISTRGVQLLSRYLGTALFSLATYLGVTFDADTTNKAVLVVATCLIALVCKGIDLLSHKMQEAETAKELEEERRLGAAMLVKAQAGSSTFLKLLIVGTLLFCAGCKTVDQIAAAAGAGAAGAIAHTAINFSYDPATGLANAVVTFKDASGRECTRAMTADELTAQCKQMNDQAQSDLKASYQRAVKEMRAREKIEIEKLRAERKLCGKPMPPIPASQEAAPPVSVAPNQGPQVGDEVVPTATADDGSFSIPAEKGFWRVVRVPAAEKCYIDAKGRKICK